MLTRITNNSQTEVTSVKRVTSNSITDAEQAQYWNGTEWTSVWPTGPSIKDFYSISETGLLSLTPGFRTALDNGQSYKDWEHGSPLPNPNTDLNVTSMYKTFENVLAETLDLSLWDVSTVTNFAYTFSNCDNILEINLANKTFSTEPIVLNNMFSLCSKLYKITFEGSTTISVANMSSFLLNSTSSAPINVNITPFDFSAIPEGSEAQLLENALKIDFAEKQIILIAKDLYSAGLLNTYGGRTNNTYCTAYEDLMPFYKRVPLHDSIGSIALEEAFEYAIVNNINYITEKGTLWTAGEPLPNPNPHKDLETLASLFFEKTNILKLDLSLWDFSSIKSISNMCNTLTALNTLILPSNPDFASLTSSSGVFAYCSNLVNFPAVSINLPEVTSLASLFVGCTKLVNFDFTLWNIPKVTNFSNAFQQCSQLSTLNLSNLANRNLEDQLNFTETFKNCTSLQSIILPQLTTESVSLASTFNGCTALSTLNLSTFAKTSINLSETFYNCRQLTELTLPEKGTNLKITSLYETFLGCTLLSTLNFSGCILDDINVEDAFLNCTALTGGLVGSFTDGDTLNNRNITSLKTGSYFIFDDPITNFYNISSGVLTLSPSYKQAVDNNIDFVVENETLWVAGEPLEPAPQDTRSLSQTFKDMTSVTKLDLSLWSLPKLTNMNATFSGCNVTEIILPENILWENITTLNACFNLCTNLSILNLPLTMNLNRATTLASMFNGCSSIPTSIFENIVINAPLVTTATLMFQYCSTLSDVSFVSNWTLPSCLNFVNFFANATSASGHVDLTQVTGNFPEKTVLFKDFLKNTKITEFTLKNITVGSFSPPTTTIIHSGFGQTDYIQKMNLENLKFSSAKLLFYDLPGLTELNTANLNFVGITDLTRMFGACTSLHTIDLSTFETPNAIKADNLFADCRALTEATLVNGPEASSLASLTNAFSRTGITSIDFIRNWNLPVLDSMMGTFSSCTNLTTVNFNAFDNIKSRLKTVNSLFNGCSNLHTVITNYTLPILETMYYMFSGCTSLTNINFLETLIVPNVTNTSYMFNGCTGLISIESFQINNYQKLETVSHMFNGCTGLTNATMIASEPSEILSDVTYMFAGCTQLESLTLDNISTQPLTLTRICNNATNLKTVTLSNITIQQCMGTGIPSTGNIVTAPTLTSFLGASVKGVTSININDVSCANNASLYGMFAGLIYLTNINVSNFNTLGVTNMGGMFAGLNNITNLNDIVSILDTSSVTNMGGMFMYNTFKLSDLNLSNWNTNNVTSMNRMFLSCSNLENLNFLSTLNLTSLIDMSYMFASREARAYLNRTRVLPANFKTAPVQIITGLFHMYLTSSLTEYEGYTHIDVSNLNNATLTDISYLCSGQKNLEELIFSTDTSGSPIICNASFVNCTKLTSLDISGFDMNNATSIMTFSGLSNLTEIIGTWSYIQANSLGSLFNGCSSLSENDIINFLEVINLENISSFGSSLNGTMITNNNFFNNLNINYSAITNITALFEGCTNLVSVDMSMFNFDIITSMSSAFAGTGLTNFDFLKNKNFGALTSMSSAFAGTPISDTSFVNDMYMPKLNSVSELFEGCLNLVDAHINVSWPLVAALSSMFANCTNMLSFDAHESNFSNVYALSSMFSSCRKIRKILMGDIISSRNITAISSFVIPYGAAAVGTTCVIDISKFNLAISSSSSGRNAFSNESGGMFVLMKAGTSTKNLGGYNASKFAFKNSELYGVTISGGNAFLVPRFEKAIIEGTSYIVNEETLWEVDTPLPILPTTVTSIVNIFMGLPYTKLDLSLWDVSAITNFANTFSDCTMLTDLNTSNWNLTAGTNLSSMFSNCSALSGVLDLSTWTFGGSSKSIAGMFNGCTGLTQINVLNWDVSLVTRMGRLFKDCTSITSFDLSTWELTTSTTELEDMFENCTSATVGYAKTEVYVNKLNATITGKPATWEFVVKPTP